jgi:pyridoxal phosphate enzyme (YggS family)
MVSIDKKIEVVAITKNQSLDKIKNILNSGFHILGNNYVQEGKGLMHQLREHQIQWHFVGHIQSRKIKYLLDYHCVESIDRIKVAEELNSELEKINKKIEILIQINIGKEPQKSGVSVEVLDSFILEIKKLKYLNFQGFMSMVPNISNLEERRPYFKEMKKIFEKYKKDFSLKTLSMGTSEDYLIAIEEGATRVRLGTVLFGPREY